MHADLDGARLAPRSRRREAPHSARAGSGKPDFDKLHCAACDHQAFLHGFDLLVLNGEASRLPA
jgi:hypothetical protein